MGVQTAPDAFAEGVEIPIRRTARTARNQGNGFKFILSLARRRALRVFR